MDATTSNRLARGLFAASQGINQMVQLRMAQAQQMFKERVFEMQQKVAQQDHQDTLDLKRQSLQAQIDARKQASADRADRLAWQKQETANSQAMREQSIQNAMEASKERLAMMQSNLELRKQMALEHKDEVGSQGLKNQFSQLDAAQRRLDSLVRQQQSLSEQYSSAAKNFDKAGMARLAPQLQSLQDSISAYSQGLDKMGAAIGQKTGLTMPTTQVPQAARPKEGGQYIKLRDGTFLPYDPKNVPEGLNPHPVPIGTPRSAIQPGGIYTFTQPGLNQPNGAVSPLPPPSQDGATPQQFFPPSSE